MTKSQVDVTNLVVVDGSNIATEGRSVPSLAQLNDAVLALTSEFPDISVTVVVDATFGHRVDKSEVAEFDEAVAHNELVTPPAGAIGRGDAFVLSIANKVGARIFSNDSFQEFHGVYPWLFDEGRLIGGKPVPHVGWVFVNRVPVRGPVSRKARSAGKESGGSRRTASKLASMPMPIPTSPPPGRAAAKLAEPAADAVTAASGRGRRRKHVEAVEEPLPATGKDAVQPTPAAAPASGGPVNDLLPFLEFVEHHPVGTAVTATVDSYSSHGAYVKIGDVRGYVPLRLMATPPPRSAREVMRLGDDVALVVSSFAPTRRSIDMAVPGLADVATVAAEASPRRTGRKAAASAEPTTPTPDAAPAAPAQPSRRRRGTAAAEQAAPDVEAKLATRSRRIAKEPAAAAQVETAPEEQRPSNASGAKKAAATSAAAKKAQTKTSGSKTPASKSSASKSSASKSSASKSSASKSSATKSSATKSSASKSSASKSSASKKSGAATSGAAKKSAAKQSEAAKKLAGAQPSTDGATSADESVSPSPSPSPTPTKRGRAAKAAASADVTSPRPSTRRATKKAAAKPADGTTVEHASAPAKPASHRRRSKPAARD